MNNPLSRQPIGPCRIVLISNPLQAPGLGTGGHQVTVHYWLKPLAVVLFGFICLGTRCPGLPSDLPEDRDPAPDSQDDVADLIVTQTGQGSVTLDPPGGTYTLGQTVRLTANADVGWRFVHWAGDLTAAANPADLLLDDDKQVTAVFMGGNPTSRFEGSDEGWRVTGNGNATLPFHHLSGGRPGGFLSAVDATSDIWYWDAPASFLGNVSAAHGRTLFFDLFESIVTSPTSTEDVILRGGGMVLAFDIPENVHPMTGWTSFSIPLTEMDNRWLNVSTGDRPTAAEMLQVLSDLTHLQIRGDYHNSRQGTPATAGLDNVVLDLGNGSVCPVRTQNVVSSFDADVQDWLIVGNDAEGDAGASLPDFNAAGGRPSGFISAVDQTTRTWFWDAPDSYLGDVSAAHGRTLFFDLFESIVTAPTSTEDVILRGGGIVLLFDIPESVHPMTGWTSFAIPLTETDDRWLNVITGDRPTAAEMLQVLSCLRQMQIRGDYHNSRQGTPATAGLDNVILDLGSSPVCPPRTQNVVSSFDADADQWLVLANDPQGDAGASSPNFSPTGGNPGGFVSVLDATAQVWYWDAPAKFLGDISAAHGRSLSFDFAETIRNQDPTVNDLILRGGGIVLVFDIASAMHPDSAFTTIQVPLTETDNRWLNVYTGDHPTAAEMLQVLSCLRQLQIRGDYHNSGQGTPAVGGLDNVILSLQ